MKLSESKDIVEVNNDCSSRFTIKNKRVNNKGSSKQPITECDNSKCSDDIGTTSTSHDMHIRKSITYFDILISNGAISILKRKSNLDIASRTHFLYSSNTFILNDLHCRNCYDITVIFCRSINNQCSKSAIVSKRICRPSCIE